MSFVSGNSESVRALHSLFKGTMDKIEQDTEALEKGKKTVLDGWNDEGAAEVEDMVTTIKNALKGATESRQNVEKALEAYADFLEKK